MTIIKNATLITMIDEYPFLSDLAIGNGKIIALSPNIVPAAHDQVVDLNGMFLMPGIVDAHCHIGMWEDGLAFEGDDGNETTDPISPQLRAIDAINPMDNCFVEAREAGVTTVVTGPGSANVICGTFAALKTVGTCVDDMVIKDPIAMKIAFGENPKRVYSQQQKTPSTRMATAALLREALKKAWVYMQKVKRAGEDISKYPEYDAKCEALLPVLRKEIPLKAHAHRADDIQTAIRIAKEFDCQLTLDHCTEGYLITDDLLKANVPVIIGPIMCDRGKPELKNLTMKAPGILHRAGVKFAMMSDHPVISNQYLLTTAALAVREGLDALTALRSITLHAAQAVGLGERLGSIEKGKDADLVAFSHHPLDIRAKVIQAWIDGKAIFPSVRVF